MNIKVEKKSGPITYRLTSYHLFLKANHILVIPSIMSYLMCLGGNFSEKYDRKGYIGAEWLSVDPKSCQIN
jgi:hypothetical protein